ncbi:hypothetical protein N008_09775 [Hymenobacter sp. APR13]|nr:hypothetical protein N008_09775 [Hymenobacter sp. APR13]
MHAYHLVGRQKAIGNALLKRVGVDRLAEVIVVRTLLVVAGRGSEAQVGGVGEVVQDGPPPRIGGSAAPVALVYHNQIEKAGAELLIGFGLGVVAAEPLVEG